MIQKILLGLSLLANVVLLVLVLMPPSLVPGTLSLAQPPAQDATHTGVFLQQLFASHVESLGTPEDQYWVQSPLAAQSSHLKELLDAQSRMRDAVVAEYGAQAVMDAAFQTLFHPLALQAPFLSSAEQIALQRAQLEQQIKLFENQQLLAGPPGLSPVPGGPALEFSDPVSVLDETSRLEYELRMSPLADLLRGSGAQFTEATFRQAFALLAPFFGSTGPVTPEAMNIYRKQLTGLVGVSSTLAIWSQIDPSLAAQVSIGRQRGLSDDDLLDAYHIIATANVMLYEARQIRGKDAKASRSMMRRALDTRREQLTDLVGAELADLLMTARPPSRFTPGQGFIPGSGSPF